MKYRLIGIFAMCAGPCLVFPIRYAITQSRYAVRFILGYARSVEKNNQFMNRKELLKEIDNARREYIRRRDSDWRGYAKCISCGKFIELISAQVGHWYPRQYDWSTELGGDERNVNLQCQQCNGFKRGNQIGYAVGLQRKYGRDVLLELEKKKKPKKWKVGELEKVLEMYKQLTIKL